MTEDILKIDFMSDWRELIENELVTAGYQVNKDEETRNLTIKYYNLLKRLISNGPRKLFYSDSFNCPDESKPGLKALVDKFVRGEKVSPHLSKTIKDIEYNDPMLNDWGIHHFHLGTETDNSGFIKRTGPLLFARITQNEAYCVNVFTHGAWSRQEIVEILHRNWPDTILQYKINRAQPVALHEIKDEHIKQFRDAGMTTMIQVSDGSVYMPTGGGYMLDGTSMQVVRQTIKMIRTIDQLQLRVVNEFQSMLDDFAKQGHTLIPPYECKLEFEDNSVYMIEINNKIAVKLADMV